MGREVKLAQPLVLSTGVWTPGPFDQISILRRIRFGGPPRFPRHRIAKCPKMSQKLDVSRQTSPYLSSTSKQSMQRYTKRHSRLPSLHSTQQHKPISNASHSSIPFPPLPQLSISHQQYNPPSTHQNVPPSTTTSTTAIPLLPPRRTLRPHHPGPPLPGPRSTKPNQPKVPPTV